MEYIVTNRFQPDVDEPYRTYSEVDEARRETRRVEFYDSGACFAYGAELGNEAALAKEPFPEDLRLLEEAGKIEVKACAAGLFLEAWEQAQYWPNSSMMGQIF